MEEKRCAKCNAVNPAAARFCMQCGGGFPAPDQAAGPALGDSGERRQISVMFCDLVGSSELSERIDAEDYQEVIRQYHRLVAEAVSPYAGHIAQLLGDGVLIYFGYPISHENDGDSAVLSALSILQALGARDACARLAVDSLPVRIGIHTGEVVIGRLGSRDHAETLAVGDTTNIAARVEGIAPINGVAITATTRRLLGRSYDVRSLGKQTLKGLQEPVSVFHVVGTSETQSLVASTTPIVGREDERDALKSLWDRLCSGGSGSVVRVAGEAGLGKTRLVAEFLASVDPELTRSQRIQCSAFTMNTPLAPIADWMRRSLALPRVTGTALRTALADALDGLQLADPEAARLLALMMGAQDDPLIAEHGAERVRRRTMLCISDFLRRRTPQPGIVHLEDAHWLDPTTGEWVEHWVTEMSQLPLLMIITHRPEFQPTWPVESEAQPIALQRLSDEASRRIVWSQARDSIPAGLVDRIIERADGIPLFIEELTKTMREHHDEWQANLQVPMTLKDSLMGRLDRLSRGGRELAQVAAAVGREFSWRLLRTLFGGDELTYALDELLAAELIYPDPAQPDSFVFKHALVLDTAYESLLNRDRRRLHGRIADSLQTHFADTITSEPEELARHLAAAGRYAEAALRYSAAGRHAALRASYHEAVEHYRTAAALMLDHGVDDVGQELHVNVQLGNTLMGAHGYASELTLPVWQHAADLARKAKNMDELSSALNGQAVYSQFQGLSSMNRRLCDEILDIAERHQSRVAAVRGNCSLGQHYFYRGDAERALHHLEASIALYQPGDFDLITYGIGTDQGVTSMAVASMVCCWLGRLDSALQYAQSAEHLARDIGSPISLATGRMFLCMCHAARGDLPLAVDIAAEIMQESKELRFPFWLGFAQLHYGLNRLRLERDPAALDDVIAGVTLLSGSGARGGGAVSGMTQVAEAYWLAGKAPEASQLLAGAQAIPEETGQYYFQPEVLRLQGLIALDTDRVLGLNKLGEAVEFANRLKAPGLALRAAYQLAEQLRDDGRIDEARSILVNALEPISEGHTSASVSAARMLLTQVTA